MLLRIESSRLRWWPLLGALELYRSDNSTQPDPLLFQIAVRQIDLHFPICTSRRSHTFQPLCPPLESPGPRTSVRRAEDCGQCTMICPDGEPKSKQRVGRVLASPSLRQCFMVKSNLTLSADVRVQEANGMEDFLEVCDGASTELHRALVPLPQSTPRSSS